MQKSSRTLIALTAGVLTSLAQSPALACPACKQLIADRTTQFGASLGLGFYWSIVALLAVPFISMSTVAWLLVRATRRHQQWLRRTSPTAG